MIHPKSPLAISNFIKAKIRDLSKNLIQEYGISDKGPKRTPLIYFGVFLVSGLFLFSVFGAIMGLNSLGFRDFIFSAWGAEATVAPDDFFLVPQKNFSSNPVEMNLVQQNSIVGVAAPAAVKTQTFGVLSDSEPQGARTEIIEYNAEQGETISSIAAKFGISTQTVLWANDLKKGAAIKPGESLIILPVSGVIHHVKKGDAIGGIALKYSAKTEDIIAFNELSGEGDIFIGDILMVPGGAIPAPSKTLSPTLAPLASSYFIPPTASRTITQGLHWYNAVDFDGECGDPVYAAAGGEVQRVSYGWNGGAGNYLNILHPNGVVTMYGHISAGLVSPGQTVSQGEIVALVGGKPGTPGAGISTGCHVHFGVSGARNPFVR